MPRLTGPRTTTAKFNLDDAGWNGALADAAASWVPSRATGPPPRPAGSGAILEVATGVHLRRGMSDGTDNAGACNYWILFVAFLQRHPASGMDLIFYRTQG